MQLDQGKIALHPREEEGGRNASANKQSGQQAERCVYVRVCVGDAIGPRVEGSGRGDRRRRRAGAPAPPRFAHPASGLSFRI